MVYDIDWQFLGVFVIGRESALVEQKDGTGVGTFFHRLFKLFWLQHKAFGQLISYFPALLLKRALKNQSTGNSIRIVMTKNQRSCRFFDDLKNFLQTIAAFFQAVPLGLIALYVLKFLLQNDRFLHN
ncbi:MAG: hypothetical protein ACD_39C00985G0001 [uncultured bacterium]|nr:MAG: hypothetical protein ACD_39C00985G0001 [uncultured bacterium]